jgi:hypothetical protein
MGKAYLTATSGKLVLELPKKEGIEITTISQFVELLGDHDCMCSSSVDHPEDFTRDPEVIKLCKLIRG